jgi:hypothetical protein
MRTGGSHATSPADVGRLLAVVGHVEGEPALPLRVVHAQSVTVLQRGKAGDGAAGVEGNGEGRQNVVHGVELDHAAVPDENVRENRE